MRSDRQKVKQIILNLLINAVKFTPQGTITVSAGYEPRTRKFAITVTDTGVGIVARGPARASSRTSSRRTTRPPGPTAGAGLGLAICRRLATMLGGEIRLESKLGEGSTFTLVLPRRRGRAMKKAASRP